MNQQPTTRTTPLAIWSLVLAIVGLILIGPLGTIPAVICGHLALSRIKRSAGALAGNGLAIGGLVVGYIGIVLQLVVLPALLLPAIAQAREKAQRISGANHLKEIVISLEVYAVDHRDNYPPNLQVLVPYTDPAVFVSPATGNDPGQMGNVDLWSDYVLAVSGRRSKYSGNDVLAFSKPQCYEGEGGNVAFVDGSVKWCPRREYQRLTEGLAR